MQIFDQIARDSTGDTVNGCQLISHFHVEEDLKRNECVKLIFSKIS